MSLAVTENVSQSWLPPAFLLLVGTASLLLASITKTYIEDVPTGIKDNVTAGWLHGTAEEAFADRLLGSDDHAATDEETSNTTYAEKIALPLSDSSVKDVIIVESGTGAFPAPSWSAKCVTAVQQDDSVSAGCVPAGLRTYLRFAGLAAYTKVVQNYSLTWCLIGVPCQEPNPSQHWLFPVEHVGDSRFVEGPIRWKKNPSLCWTALGGSIQVKTSWFFWEDLQPLTLETCTLSPMQIFQIDALDLWKSFYILHNQSGKRRFVTGKDGIGQEALSLRSANGFGHFSFSVSSWFGQWDSSIARSLFGEELDDLIFKVARVWNLILAVFFLVIYVPACGMGAKSVYRAPACNWFRLFCYDTEASTKLRVLVNQHRIQRAHIAFKFCNALVGPLLLTEVWWMCKVYASGRSQDRHAVHSALYDRETLPLLVLASTSLLFCKFPGFLTGRTLDFAHVVVSIVWVCRYQMIFSVFERHESLTSDATIMVLRIACNNVFGNARLATFLESIVTTAQLMSVRNTIHHDTFYWFRACLAVIIGLSLVWHTEVATKRNARNIYDAGQSKTIEKQASRLLHGMCDVVVSIADDGVIQKDNQKLSAILLRDINRSLAGIVLHHYMKGDDVHRFKQRVMELQEESGMEEPIQPLHVDLYDSQSNKVPVELFCTRVSNVFDVPNNLVGICLVREWEADPVGELPQAPKDCVDDSSSSSASSGLSDEEISPAGFYFSDLRLKVWAAFCANTFHIDRCSDCYRKLANDTTLFTDAMLSSSKFVEEFQCFFQPLLDGRATLDNRLHATVSMLLVGIEGDFVRRKSDRTRKSRVYEVSMVIVPLRLDPPQVLAKLLKVKRTPRNDGQARGTPSQTMHSSCADAHHFSPVALEEQVEPTNAVTVTFLAYELQVRRCSQSFVEVFGKLPPVLHLLDWLQDGARHISSMRALCERTELFPHEDFGELTYATTWKLQSPVLKADGVVVIADANLSLQAKSKSNIDGSDSRLEVCATLTNIRRNPAGIDVQPVTQGKRQLAL